MLKNPSIILEDVWCRAHYSDCRMLCPRSIYQWWREIWLKFPQICGKKRQIYLKTHIDLNSRQEWDQELSHFQRERGHNWQSQQSQRVRQ
jgi:hypothetical protein